MRQYLDLLDRILREGADKNDRTGTGTYSVFGHQMRFDLAEGFPLLTTKKLFTKGIIYELLWMLAGDTNVQWLQERGVHIWDEWADAEGNLGPVYGAQWRSWAYPIWREESYHAGHDPDKTDPAHWERATLDQITQVISDVRANPYSRRHIVTAWNPPDIPKMALAPCHCLFQFYVVHGRLSCQLYQRSADVFLGVPFNIASYALLTMMVAQVCDLQPGEFVHTFGDVHLYKNHVEQARLQLTREPRPLPRMEINPAVRDIDAFRYDDFMLVGYDPHPHISAPVSK